MSFSERYHFKKIMHLQYANHDLKELACILLVRSILEYSSTVWDTFYQKDIDRLEMVQQ